MRVAALYDIHGNLPALEAVLEEVARERIDRIVIGGDVLPGPMPGETLDALAALDTPVEFIHGNGETDTLRVRRGEEPTRVPAPFRETLRWTADALSDERAAGIATWPLTRELELAPPGRVMFCHATPRDDNEIFTRLTPEERLRPVFEGIAADIVVCGHTHMQFVRTVAGVRVVNAGSVGMPFGEPGAYWALIDDDVALRRTAYDFAGATRRIRATACPDAARFEIERPASAAEMTDVFEHAALR